jgi:branched-chain amino acid aminotransferase
LLLLLLLLSFSHLTRRMQFKSIVVSVLSLELCVNLIDAMAPPAVATTTPRTPLPPKAGIEFEALPWNMNLPEEVNYVHLTTTGEWTPEHYDASTDSGTLFHSVYKYSETCLPVYPSTTSLNYGTTIWEGLKCFRKKDGTPVVFRPDRNFARFVRGAEQMCLPKPSRELFLRGVQLVLQENSHLMYVSLLVDFMGVTYLFLFGCMVALGTMICMDICILLYSHLLVLSKKPTGWRRNEVVCSSHASWIGSAAGSIP